MLKKILLSALVPGILLAVPGSLGAQAGKAMAADPWYGRTTKAQFQPARTVDGFQLDWPKKDWLMLPSAGSLSLVMTTKKGDALVVVERTVLRQPLEPSDITELFAQLESDAVKEKGQVLDVQARVIDANGRRLVAVQFQRTGMLGPERVRQYSLPVGKNLYRLICISTAAQFLSYDPLFSHMAASFTATAE